MSDETAPEVAPSGYQVYLDERKQLVEAARESSRTFDKAILTFASAAFGFSIAFLKEAAPHPVASSLVWLKVSWVCFSLSLFLIMLSFLFSHQACVWSIERTFEQVVVGQTGKSNPWGRATTLLNYVIVVLLFIAVAAWGGFVFGNLNVGEGQTMSGQAKPEYEQRGYTPPPPPQQRPSQPAQPAPQQQPAQAPPVEKK